MTVGTRAQVWHGTADRTSGGLTKTDLFMKNGRLRSKRASRSAKKNQNLKKAGWTFKKGEFVLLCAFRTYSYGVSSGGFY